MRPLAPLTITLDQAHDIEAMIVTDAGVWLIGKDKASRVWLNGVYVGTLSKPDGKPLRFVTGADSTRELALIRTYGALYEFAIIDGRLQMRANRALPLMPEAQGETIALTPDGYFTMSEMAGRGHTWAHEYRGCL